MGRKKQKSSLRKIVPHSDRAKAYFLLLINTFFFGAALPIVKWGAPDLSPAVFLFYRLTFVAVVTLPLLVWLWPHLRRNTTWVWRALLIELLGTTIGLGLIYVALQISTAVEVSILLTAGPVFLTFSGMIFLKEKVERHEWVGLVFSALGVLLLGLIPIINNQWQFSLTASILATILIFFYHLFNTAYYTLAKPVYKKINTLFVPIASSWVGIVTFGGYLLFFAHEGSVASLWTHAIQDFGQIPILITLLFMSIGTTIIGWTAYIKAQELIEISEAGLFTYLQPAVYIPLGAVLLGERVSSLQVVALLLIIVGVVTAGRRNKGEV